MDVTAKRLPDAVELAAAIGGQLLGMDVRYSKRRDPVTEDVLRKFLERLCHPDADDLVLVEIKAEMPGEPGRPVKTISGSGQERIEQTVVRKAERAAFAEDWKTVHHAKVWYDGYRFTIHFPLPEESPLALSYSDMRTNRFSMGASPRTLDCSGQVVWENEGNQQDPYADLPDKRIECPDCGHEWKIGDCRPPLHRKLYIEVHHQRAWQIISNKADKAMKDLTIEVPGIASGLRRARLHRRPGRE